MEDYKFKLEQYKPGGSNRYECPQCHEKKSFVRYVDERGNYVSDIVGRCNREEKCGYHLTPSEYFRNKGIDYTPVIKIEPKPILPIDYIPEDVMIRTLRTENNLIQFLIKYFSLSDVARTIDRYRIGDTKDGRVIYWQIDAEDKIRTGKIMAYDPNTGHRIKGVDGVIGWTHRYIKQPYNLQQCLFGLHLIRRESKPVAIVESEKSAIIGSMAIPGYIWLATGGKGNFRLMEDAMGKDVTLFPDLGAFDAWSGHAAEYGFKVSRLLEDIALPEDRENGLDIADYIIREKENGNEHQISDNKQVAA